MKLLVNGIIYDSTKTPILIDFDENEEQMFNMKRFVSGPPDMTEKERSELIRKDLFSCTHDNKWFDVTEGFYYCCSDCGERDV